MHELRYGRRSLALDLVEEFRHPAIDMLTVSLVNWGVLKEGDFYRETDGGVRMTPEALKRYFEAYERRMAKPFSDPDGEQTVSFRALFRTQAESLEKLVLEGRPYEPFLVQ